LIKNNFKIFDRVINKNSPTLIIAEIGINHMGDEDLCKEMILSALDSGADCVKLQTINEEESYLPNTESYKVFKGTQLSLQAIKKLKNIAEDNNGFLFSTPGDISSLRLLKKANLQAYKVSSGLFTNIPLIQEIIKYNEPIILSTGMAKEEEIERVMSLMKREGITNIALLHCISLYPAPYSSLNLSYISKISEKYNVITGYSDHSEGEIACLTAVSMGAKIIEKHFTIDNSIKGADNRTSMEANAFKNMCKNIRNIEKMLYLSDEKPHHKELELRNSRYRMLVAKRDLQSGEKLTLENVNFMRGSGDAHKFIMAYDWDQIKGKTCISNLKKNTLITLDLLRD